MKIFKRVIIALLSIGAICCAFFVDLFNFRASSNIIMYAAEEKLNAIEFFEMIQKYQGAGTPDVLLKYQVNILIMLVLFAVIIAVAVIIIILSTFLKDSKYTTACSILSFIGIMSSVGMRAVFSPIANAVKSGAITIGAISGTGFLDSFAKLDSFTLGLAPTVIFSIFTAILLINVITDTFSKKSKKI